MPPAAPVPQIYVLTLRGRQVTKKDKLRPRKGGLYYDETTSALINSYTWQAKFQWRDRNGPKPPLDKFAYSMDLINQRGDPDGIVTTTLDCLKDAGVITDDAAKHCIRWKGQAYQDPSTEPRVIVQLERA